MRTLVMVALCASLAAGNRAAAQEAPAPPNANRSTEPGAGQTNGQSLPVDLKAKNIREETVTMRPDVDEAAGGQRVTVLSDMGDRKFVEQAAKQGMAEVELGKLAAERGSSPEVRQLGQRIADDHDKANAELRQLATEKKFRLPVDMAPEQKRKIEALSKKSGSAFDQEYLKTLVQDHKQDVTAFKREMSNAAANPAVKGWAQRTLPMLQAHEQLAKRHQRALK